MAKVDAKSLKRSTMAAGFAQAWRLVSRFLLTPIVIGKIGLEGYGVWILIFSVCGYVGMFHTSFGVAYAKLTAQYDGREDYDGLSRVLSSGIMLVGAIGLIGLLLIRQFSEPVLEVLGVPGELLADGRAALLLVAAALFLRMSFGSVFQMLAGLQRTDLQHKFNVIGSTIEFGVTLALLYAGWGLIGLAMGYFASEVIATRLAWVRMRRLCPGVRVSPLLTTRAGLREITALGGKFQLLSFLSTGLVKAIKLLISATCGVAALGIFELADKLLWFAKISSSAVISPLMPAFASLFASGEEEKRRELFFFSSKLIAVTAGVSMGGLVALADRLIVMWTGQEFAEAAWTIRVLALGQFFWIMTAVGTSSLRGKGTVRLELGYSVMRAVMIALLFGPALYFAEYRGIVMALFVSRLTSSVWFLAKSATLEGLTVAGYFREILSRTLAVVLAAVAIMMLLMPTLSFAGIGLSARWQAAVEIAVLGGIFVLVTTAITWLASFRPEERAYLAARFLPKRFRRWVAAGTLT